ncbi:hypothetical protein P170DRAFT_406346 [Aspergillus steynii IBT 23096]|uniref:Zn(2)-C6 fungal-type domain-containing protein n=1 Tax=Aspergillus steynii IBT 23096 TaxID=1392250 RepID=A0A2I2GDD1_9EURO|nr:uncharacterized protein P170DRAFT_406346 [Aspergillus steynii IBT 23096]PLB50916.1 hypothetical protein P170DRAFT_406346 [Aspergillus steynii IBT 23096]
MQTPRLSKSCDQCRARKVRCLVPPESSGERSACTHCIKRNEVCQFSNSKRSSRWRTESKPSQNAPAEGHAHSSGLFIDRLLQDPAEEAFLFDEFSVLRAHDKQVSSSGIAFFSEERIQSLTRVIGNSRLRDLIHQMDLTIRTRLLARSDHEVTQSPLNRAPNPDTIPLKQAEAYIKSYFDNVHPIFPFVDQHSFEEKVKDLHTSVSFNTHPVFSTLYHAVLALGCQYHGGGSFDPGKGTAWKFFQTSLGHIPRLVLARESLIAVQAITAMAVFAMNACCLQVDHTLLAEASRMVLALRYHKSSVVDANPTECHRVFWVVYHLEKQYRFQGRRASAIADYDVGCQVPNVPESIFGEFNWFLASIRISRIFSIAYACLFSVDASTHSPGQLVSALNHVRKLLEDWRQSIPLEYRPGESVRPAFQSRPALKEIALRTNFYYYHLVITSERLKLRLASDQQKARESEEVLLKAAGAIIELSSLIDVEPYTPTFLLATMPLAALFIVFDFVVHHPNHPETRQHLMLLDIVSGHFSLLEQRSRGTLPGGYLSYFSFIAKGYVENVERQATDDCNQEAQNARGTHDLPVERLETCAANSVDTDHRQTDSSGDERRRATRSESSIQSQSHTFDNYFSDEGSWPTSMQTATEADLGALFASVIDWENVYQGAQEI